MTERDSRPHWSYSSISQFLRCPLQYYFERILRLPRRSISEAQMLGSSVHAALAFNHRQLQARGPVTIDQIHDAFLSAWEAQAVQIPIHSGEKRSHADTKALGIALLDVYLDAEPPGNIVSVEQPILAPMVNSAGVYLEKPLLIVTDLITREGDGALKVHEIKTSARSYSQTDVSTSLQPTCYGHAVHEMTGEEPSLEYVVLVKTKVPKLQRIEAVRTTSDFGRLGDIVEAVGRSIDAESFFPIESPLNCSGCSFYRECRAWTGPGSSISGDREVLEIEEPVPC